MLQIKNISKQYKTGDLVQNALNDVSLNFRDNEFVSILGPSGSGKTTLLNIIGGLDRYDSGDLIINDVSTKNYKDRDWDSYRNHTIGFVFQSYNLIPHQTVLANVELALTIGGISKKERKQRALEALDQVGLREQAHKRPNQMSGGQMQRVAIARALVNNPDILLADEPTGALDSETSVQVMQLLKKVAKDRLVIMVTHNPELAEEYSTRIVKLKDGKIISDTDPFVPEAGSLKEAEHKNLGKAAMSLLTAFSLSFNNLLTKKGRTILTAFAGSIGIIGIALILSLSTGFQNYIDKIQEDTLTSYPLTITSETADMTSALLSMVTQSGEESEEGTVRERKYMSTMFAEIGKNDLKSLKKYLEKNSEQVDDMVSLIRYQYSVVPMIYTIDSEDEITQLNPSTMLAALGGGSSMASMSSMLMSSSGTSVFNEMIENHEELKDDYNILAGEWPDNYDEVLLVLPEESGMPDVLVYSLGLRSSDELASMLSKIIAGEAVGDTGEALEFTYEELLNLPFKVVDPSAKYKYNAEYDIYEDMSNNQEFMKKVYDDALDLKISGIVCAKSGSATSGLTPGIAYTKELTEYVIGKAFESEIVQKQLANREINVFSNKRFDDDSEEAGLDFKDMISIDMDMITSAFGGGISEKDIADKTQAYMNNIMASISADTTPAKERFLDTFVTLANDMMTTYIDENKNPVTNAATIKEEQIESIISTFLAKESSQKLLKSLETDYVIPKDAYEAAYSGMLQGMLQMYVQLATLDMEDIKEMLTPENIEQFVNQTLESDKIVLTEEQKAAVKEFVSKTMDAWEKANSQIPDFSIDASELENSMNALLEQENVKKILEAVETQFGVPQDEIVGKFKEVIKEIASKLGIKEDVPTDSVKKDAYLTQDMVEPLINFFASQEAIMTVADTMAKSMTETVMQVEIMTNVGGLTGGLMESLAGAFNVDQEKFAAAFQFNLSEEELSRLMQTMMSAGSVEKNADTNLISLGYQNLDEPSSISFYFKDFEAKELFVDFLEDYNEKMEAEDEEKVVKYTDLTGFLMSSVKTIVDSVSYVLIAFVSISLVVSSIMIGIITYISVLERTKEIGVLRAIGASKKNISSIFNAETFIVGLFAGLIGIGVTLALVPLINYIIHTLTGNMDINAVLPVEGATVLVILSVILTLIGGLIPSRQAAKKDPVLALRSE